MISTAELYRRRAEKLRAKAVTRIRPELFDAAREYDELAAKLEQVLAQEPSEQ